MVPAGLGETMHGMNGLSMAPEGRSLPTTIVSKSQRLSLLNHPGGTCLLLSRRKVSSLMSSQLSSVPREPSPGILHRLQRKSWRLKSLHASRFHPAEGPRSRTGAAAPLVPNSFLLPMTNAQSMGSWRTSDLRNASRFARTAFHRRHPQIGRPIAAIMLGSNIHVFSKRRANAIAMRVATMGQTGALNLALHWAENAGDFSHLRKF
jgi:hypothetical protein